MNSCHPAASARTTTENIQTASCRMTSEVPTTQQCDSTGDPLLSSSSGTGSKGQPTMALIPNSDLASGPSISIKFANLLLFHRVQLLATWGSPSGFTDVLENL